MAAPQAVAQQLPMSLVMFPAQAAPQRLPMPLDPQQVFAFQRMRAPAVYANATVAKDAHRAVAQHAVLPQILSLTLVPQGLDFAMGAEKETRTFPDGSMDMILQ